MTEIQDITCDCTVLDDAFKAAKIFEKYGIVVIRSREVDGLIKDMRAVYSPKIQDILKILPQNQTTNLKKSSGFIVEKGEYNSAYDNKGNSLT